MTGQTEKKKRNPPWKRDELILALDLYFRGNNKNLDSNHKDVIKLSEILNSLPIHNDRPDKERFRNPNGVSMKISNSLRFDPNSANAKERDVYRQRFLESRGWTIERIWSRNWWKNSSTEIERIDQKVKELSKSEVLREKVVK
ncbi:hypothetical protein V7152_18915 [Neobacillus drentensis]|uniref:hypothetical protein n=1 Tax=Neobacillus drentensis TaxID=220684 RepID=UPI003000C143